MAEAKNHLAVELLKTIVWPSFALFVVIAFWNPLQTMARMLPSILRDVDTISVGSITVSVRRAIADKASAEVKAMLPKLSPGPLEFILMNTTSKYYYEGELGAAEQELISVGLCTSISKEALAAHSKEESEREKKKQIFLAGFNCGDLYFSYFTNLSS